MFCLCVAELVDGFFISSCFYELFESCFVEVTIEYLFALCWCKVGYVYGYLFGDHNDYVYITVYNINAPFML